MWVVELIFFSDSINNAILSIPAAHPIPGISGPPNTFIKPSYLPPPSNVSWLPKLSDLYSNTVLQ